MGITYLDAGRCGKRAHWSVVQCHADCGAAGLRPSSSRAGRSASGTWCARARGGTDAAAQYTLGSYADTVLRRLLGVSSLTVLDYSPYEDATFIHDLNLSVGDEYRGRFDARDRRRFARTRLQLPRNDANLMKMAKVGGRIFLKTPANNMCGHGFYQFSPELMSRVFIPANGFEPPIVRLVVESRYPSVEMTPHVGAYDVTDPNEVLRE